MKLYIFRCVYSGRIFKCYAYTARDAKSKIAREKGMSVYNLAHIRPQERKEYA